MKLFAAVTTVSETNPWFLSLSHQLRELWTRRKSPVSPVELTAAPVDVPGIWSKRKAGVPRVVSMFVHAAIVACAFIPWPISSKQILKQPPDGLIDIALYAPRQLVLPPNDRGGGGGGGRRQITPPSLGRLPKAADKQLVPPDPEPPKNLDPTLIAEPSLVALQLPRLPQLNLLNIGDPNGIAGPPSSGPGTGDGIGPGNGHGVGPGNGPNTGPGDYTGYTGTPSTGSGSVSAPVLVTQILPEYSDAARKARFEGRVVLDTIVLEDGSVKVIRIAHGVGYGLDENAVAAVLKWRFRPGRMNGRPVAMALNIEVNFNLR